MISYQWKQIISKEAVYTWFNALFPQVGVCVCVRVYVQGLKKPMKNIQFSEQVSRPRFEPWIPEY